MRRALPLIAAALGAALLGCNPEDPDDLFYYLGRVTDPAGAPRAGQALTLSQSPTRYTPACTVTDRPELEYTPSSAGLSKPYEAVKDVTSDGDGNFYFELMRFEIQPSQSMLRCFLISATSAAGAQARSAAFGEAIDLEFPALELWDGAELAVTPGAPPSVALPALPWAPSIDPVPVNEDGSTRSVLYDWVISGPSGALAWHQLTASDPLALEPELLEDFASPAVTLQAWFSDDVVVHGALGITRHFDYRSLAQAPAIALAGAGAAVPASRGAPCTLNGAVVAGCPLTDGALDVVLLPSWFFTGSSPDPMAPPPTDQLVLSLARSILPRRLVMRDLAAGGAGLDLTVEGSADGLTWIPIASEIVPDPGRGSPGSDGFQGSGAYLSIALDSGGQPVQQVRITTAAFGALLAAREISVFE